jgi:hypothetical protein
MSSQETEPQSGGGEPSGVLSDGALLDRQWLWALVGLSVLGLLLRAFLLDGQSLWLDEADGLRRASAADLREVLQFGAQTEPSPPLYYVLLHVWLKATAVAPVAARSFSVLFGALTVPLTGLTLRPLLGRRAALVAVLLLAVNPFHIYYSQEARSYALLLFLYVLSIHCLHRALCARRAPAWILHWLCTTACGYVHYVGGAAILGQGLYAVLAGHLKDRRTRNSVVCSLAGAAVTVSAWVLGPRFFSSVGAILRPHEPLRTAAARLPGILLHLTWDAQFGYFPGLEHAPLALLSLMLCLSVVLAAVSASAWVHLVRGPQRDAALLLGSLMAGALTVGTGVVLCTFFKSTRYFLPVLLPALGLQGVALRELWKGRLRPVCVVLTCGLGVLTVVSLRNYYVDPSCAREDWRSLAQHLNENARAGDQVVLPVFFYDAPLETYYTGSAEVISLTPVEHWSAQLRERFRADPLKGDRVYWVIRVEPKEEPDPASPGTESVHEFHRLRLIRFRPRPD